MLIPATQSGQAVYVEMDDVDVDRLGDRKLSVGSHGYTQIFWGAVMLLHRWIVIDRDGPINPGLRVDHVNRNKLDCRRANLRQVTPSENNLNRALLDRELPTGIYVARSGRYIARLKRDGYMQSLGTYDSVEEAVNVRLAALI